MKAIVTITQGNGTFNAIARIGTGSAVRASCTMGREFAARRAASKALGCDEKNVKLTEAKREMPGAFLVVMQPGVSETVICGVNTDSVFVAEYHPETFQERLDWHTTGLPDADTTVLAQDHDKEVGEAFYDGAAWRWASSTLIRGGVRAWADMPGGLP